MPTEAGATDWRVGRPFWHIQQQKPPVVFSLWELDGQTLVLDADHMDVATLTATLAK